MEKQNVMELQNMMRTLSMLKNEVSASRRQVRSKVSDIKKRMQTILAIEENRYIATCFPNEDVVAVEDEKLNALFDAIGCLELSILYPKQIAERIDDAVTKLRDCITE